ncbi:uncharacterized protein LOC122043676 [Zingiber officinale]|uniref:uncharacterized protein LOC122043676 n=1 Tax=Zingiber officinale TaxID=94328 RepID=UPI001C4CF0F5|nr:uncharacterized protein LOC122043676 [Zingiber officinale]
MSERDRNDMIKEAQNKRLSYHGRDQQESGQKSTPDQVENKVRCSKCEKIHVGECLNGTDVYYMSKKTGHFARDCPQLKEPTKGRIQQLLQNREQERVSEHSTVRVQLVYKQFRELGPTEFKGTTDPIAAEGCIRSLKMIYDFMQLTDADKVRCAIFMLRDDARVWWEGARLTVDLTTLTWADFKEIFYGKYFTVDNRTRLAQEFLELRQGDLSVAEYVRRFERGCYFVPMIASPPVEELKHFTEGLRAAIRHDVRLCRVTTFREVVDQALMSERDRNDMIKEAQNKRLSYYGRDQQESGQKSTPDQVENKVRCSKCEKIHVGECLNGTDVYYMSKKTGYFARDCPQLKEPTKGRAQEFDVILGMDWLVRYEAVIDCKQQTVKLKLPNEEFFIFHAVPQLAIPHVISVCKAQQMLSKGCEGLLVNIMVKSETRRPSLEEVEVARDFPEVFPEDIAGLPSDREVEFGKELLPGTTPASKAPY